MNGHTIDVPTNDPIVLAERLANFKELMSERAVAQKQALDAALIGAKSAVDAAFAASEKAIAKAEESQKEYNKIILALQTEVVSLKVSSSQVKGTSTGMRDMYGWIFGVAMLIAALIAAFGSHWRG